MAKITMKTSRKGLVEIASHEGIVNRPYKDSKGIWTVGIGHTASAGPPNPAKEKRTYPLEEVMEIFARDVAKFERRVRKAFTRPLTQAQFDAAVSFDFNTGGIHRASWVTHFNAGRMAQAKKAFMAWSKPPEIIPRREKERDLFFDGAYSNNGYVNVYPADARGRVVWLQGKRMLLPDTPQRPVERDPVQTAPTQPPKPETPPAGKSEGVWGEIGRAIRGLLDFILKLTGAR